MSLGWIAILLFAGGLVLIVAELLLPTHGLLGFVGIGAMLGAIGVCFAIDPWLGGGLLLACAILSPFVGAWLIHIWPYTPVGRRILLMPPAAEAPQPPPVQPGAEGVAISELRPIGVCDFSGLRLESFSDHGMIAAGAKVKVVNVVNRRPTVRPA